uniref:Secreted protein n=1 Tax=Anopheles maculatus TaxID=74869 RepID=A0A182SNI1_9DIPT
MANNRAALFRLIFCARVFLFPVSAVHGGFGGQPILENWLMVGKPGGNQISRQFPKQRPSGQVFDERERHKQQQTISRLMKLGFSEPFPDTLGRCEPFYVASIITRSEPTTRFRVNCKRTVMMQHGARTMHMTLGAHYK